MSRSRNTNQSGVVLAGRVLVGLALSASALTALTGCRGDRTDKPPRQFFPDMDQQPKWTEQAQSPFFDDGRTQRPSVAGTVAFGRTSHDPAMLGESWAGHLSAERDRMLGEDPGLYRGVRVNSDGSESFLDVMPVPVTMDLIEHGQERFTVFCTPCHGYLGNGQGTVGTRWSYSPANLLGEQYQDRAQRQGKDGYLFHVVMDGVVNPQGAKVMPGYAEKVNEHDAWAIVAYLRTLQLSQTATLDEVPAEYRPRAATGAAGSVANAGEGGGR